MSANQTTTAQNTAKNWYVNQEGDITDGEQLIAEPNYLTKESYKNAHLLAAAPDLLAACEEVLDVIEWLIPNAVAINSIKAAITKAKGVA